MKLSLPLLRLNGFVFLLAFIWGCSSAVNIKDIPAFPGAEGYGAGAVGGRGGDVYHVTNLHDKGPGSLRYGITSANGPRTIVFDTLGTIVLHSLLIVDKPFLTIAGQTAPGEGITLSNYTLYLAADHLIIRYIRSRLGDRYETEMDAISVKSGSNIMLDHISASWGIDEVFSFQSDDIDSITVQWCMITESLRYSYHHKGPHGYGQIIGSLHQSVHHNLYAHHSSRSPKVSGRRHCEVDFRNNVIYNWGYNNCYDGTASYINWVNNYYKAGPGTNDDVRHRIFKLSDDPILKENDRWRDSEKYETSLYAEGNYVDGYPHISKDNWNGGIDFQHGATEAKNRAERPFEYPTITEQSAKGAYPLVLKSAGASMARDVVDTRIVEEVRTGHITYKGSKSGDSGLIDTQNDVGGWPKLYSLPAPTDTDRDGMPDYWEDQFGLDKNTTRDNSFDNDGDGYTNLEEYLNNTDPSGEGIPIVYVRSIDSRIQEVTGSTGEFNICRTGNSVSPLTVQYTVGGSAVAEIDYKKLSGTATIAAGEVSTTVVVQPLSDRETESTELVILRLNPLSSLYHVGCPNKSLVAIEDRTENAIPSN